ncbi:guanylin-like [Sceloporus undulatus]|uniref:guanylin-like n=1 Tax=Sceloporus undulatus TaxID=8520 RepID=UPI001C4D2D4A|nr:guanylin-like [Sceloporus undulatus]
MHNSSRRTKTSDGGIMKTIVVLVIFTVLMVAHVSQASVQVQDGERSFSLESVKKLKEILGTQAGPASSRLKSQLAYVTVCTHPELPKEFYSVCQRKEAPLVFKRLSLTVQNTDQCEICANAACTGCY